MFLLDNFVLNSNELLLHISLVKIVKSREDSWDRKNLQFSLFLPHTEQHVHENFSQKMGGGLILSNPRLNTSCYKCWLHICYTVNQVLCKLNNLINPTDPVTLSVK